MEFIQTHLTEILSFIFGGGGIIAWYSERQKRKADAFSSMQGAYDNFVKDSEQRIQDMRDQLKEVKDNYQREIGRLNKRISEVETYWKEKYNSLKREFDLEKKKNQKKNE